MRFENVYATGIADGATAGLVITNLLIVLDGSILKPTSPVCVNSTAPVKSRPAGGVQIVLTNGLLIQYSNWMEPSGVIVGNVKLKRCDVSAEGLGSATVTFRLLSCAAETGMVTKSSDTAMRSDATTECIFFSF